MAEGTAVAAPDAKAAPVTPEVKATPASQAKDEATETIKVNGKEMKVTKAQLISLAQKGAFADGRLKSMDVLKGKTEALIKALKTPEGMLGVLKDPSLGASPKEVFKALMNSDVIDDELKEVMSQWVYNNVVVQAKKTPEQIENDKKLTEYEKLKKQETERKAAQEKTELQAKVNQIYQAVRSEVTKQVLADKTFPQTEGSIRAVVEKLRVMNKKGAPISAETITKALGLVKKDHVLHQQSMLDALEDPEQLISLIGEARALKISKALVARLKAKGAKLPEPQKQEVEGERREKTTDRIDRKLGRTPQGYHVLDI